MTKKFRNSLFMISIILLIVTLLIGSVSADDSILADEPLSINQDDSDLSVSLDDSSSVLDDDSFSGDLATSESESNLKDDDVGSFSDLNTEISTKDVVDLEKDYVYSASSDTDYQNGIVIDKAVTINGNNYLLNSSGELLFNIGSNGVLTLNNVRIYNNYSRVDPVIKNGGIVFLNNVTFTFDRRLENSTTGLKYSTIENNGNMTISNCNFIDSTVEIKAFSSSSQRPKTLYFYGLVYNNGGTLTIENTLFNNNQFASPNQIGNSPRITAILENANGKTTLNNVSVIDNYCNYSNTQYNYFGFVKNNNDGELIINDTLFKNNTLIHNQNNVNSKGVINSEGSSLTVTNSTFKDNTVQYQVITTSDEYIDIERNVFDSNNVRAINVLNVPEEAKVNYCIFVNNGNEDVIKSADEDLDINYNYWGTNDPDWNTISDDESDLFPANYVIMGIAAGEDITVGKNNIVNVTLNQIKSTGSGAIQDLTTGTMPDYNVSVKSTNLDSTETVLIENGIGEYNYVPESEGEDTLTVFDHGNEISSIGVNVNPAPVSDGSYTSLNDKIVNYDGKITLEMDYAYDSSKDTAFKNGITIDKDIVIDGNGFSINSTDQAKIFNIVAGASLTLENIILLNDYAVTQSAIINAGQLIFNNVTFTAKRTNITASANLQAPIVNTGDLTIKDSKFLDSVVNHTGATTCYVYGALIYNNKGNLEIENTLFENNGIVTGAKMVTINGALIYNSGNFSLNHVNVSNNYVNIADTATTASAFGLIYAGAATSNITVNDTVFENNVVLSLAKTDNSMANVMRITNGAISVNNSKFIRNIGSKNAGAIAYVGNDLITIENTLFDSNAVSGSGGALFIQGNLVSNNNIYVRNTAKHTGGAIYNYGYYDTGRTDIGNLLSTNDVFEANTVETPVVSNLVIAQGGAIYAYSGNLTLINDTFTKNKAIGGDGGVLYNNPNSHLNATHCIFTDNEATTLAQWPQSTGFGSLMFIAEPEHINTELPALINIEYSIIENNTAENQYLIVAIPPGVDNLDYTLSDYEVRVNNNYWGTNSPNFSELIGVYESDITLVSPLNFVIMTIEGPDSVLPNSETQYTINLNKANESGEIVEINGTLPDYEIDLEPLKNPVNPETVIIKDGTASFIYIANIEGEDTVYGTKNLDERCEKVINVEKPFEGNELYVSANAETSGDGTLESPLKTLREAIELANSADHPVSIYILNGTYDDTNLTITNNLTISNYEDSEVTFDANNEGWFLYSNDVNNNLTLIGLTFMNGNRYDSSDSTEGGVIKTEGHLDVINCTFINNYGGSGGAIQVKNNGANIENSTFRYNRAEYNGAAVQVYGGETNLINDTFDNNTAKRQGGAVRVQGDLNIEGSTFENNYAGTGNFAGYGGAVRITDGDLTVNNSEFRNNSAKFEGGAISAGDDSQYSTNHYSFNVDNSVFVENQARTGAGIVANDGINITNSVIANNSVPNSTSARYGQGTGIYVLNGDSNITGNQILNNTNPYNSEAVDVYINQGTVDARGNDWGEDEDPRIAGDGEIIVDPVRVVPDINVTSVEEVKVGEDVTVYIELPETIVSNLSVICGDLTIEDITIESGKANVTIPMLVVGDALISVKFGGDESYKPKTVNVTVKVNKLNTNMDIDIDDNGNILVALSDENNNKISNANIKVNINGAYTPDGLVTDENGLAIFNAIEGKFKITFEYEGNDSLMASNSSIFYIYVKNDTEPVVKKDTQIDFKDMVTTAVDVNTDGRVGEYFQIVLKDSDGKALPNKLVKIGFNGKVYERTTDQDGKAKLQINLERADIYTFAVSFLGDDEYNGTFVVAKITVKAQTPKLVVPNKSYKASAKTKSLTATFKSASGKVVANKKVTFTVNGKTYTATTNSKGIATVNVSLSSKKTYSFTVKFAGDNTYAPITKTAKLTIN